MALQDLLQRIYDAVDAEAYSTSADHVDPRFREALAEVQRVLLPPDPDPRGASKLADRLFEAGHLDRAHHLMAQGVIAASPGVADYALAARLAAEQEQAVLAIGGPHLDTNLASVDRHRGVVAFLQGHDEVALDYFTRALERQRHPRNLGNILCALVRLGEIDDAAALLAQIRASFPAAMVADLDDMVAHDPDLAVLRSETSP